MPIFLLLEILHVGQFLGRHFLLIIVVVEPESNKTFSKILNFTEEMMSTNMIVTGVSCFGLFLLDLTSTASLVLSCTKAVYISSVTIWRTDCVLRFLGAFPVESTIEIVVQVSAVFKLDNSLLSCNPDSYCTISRYFVLVVLLLVLGTSGGPSFVKNQTDL